MLVYLGWSNKVDILFWICMILSCPEVSIQLDQLHDTSSVKRYNRIVYRKIVGQLFQMEYNQSLTNTGIYQISQMSSFVRGVLTYINRHESCVDSNRLYSRLYLLGLISTLYQALNTLKAFFLLQGCTEFLQVSKIRLDISPDLLFSAL